MQFSYVATDVIPFHPSYNDKLFKTSKKWMHDKLEYVVGILEKLVKKMDTDEDARLSNLLIDEFDFEAMDVVESATKDANDDHVVSDNVIMTSADMTPPEGTLFVEAFAQVLASTEVVTSNEIDHTSEPASEMSSSAPPYVPCEQVSFPIPTSTTDNSINEVELSGSIPIQDPVASDMVSPIVPSIVEVKAFPTNTYTDEQIYRYHRQYLSCNMKIITICCILPFSLLFHCSSSASCYDTFPTDRAIALQIRNIRQFQVPFPMFAAVNLQVESYLYTQRRQFHFLTYYETNCYLFMRFHLFIFTF